MDCVPEIRDCRDRAGRPFVCSWCHPAPAAAIGQGPGARTNYGICPRCLQCKLTALPRATPHLPVPRRRRPKERDA